MARRGTVLTTFEQERREAAESALTALTENPKDRITQMACTYLLKHLQSAPDEEHSLPVAA